MIKGQSFVKISKRLFYWIFKKVLQVFSTPQYIESAWSITGIWMLNFEKISAIYTYKTPSITVKKIYIKFIMKSFLFLNTIYQLA